MQHPRLPLRALCCLPALALLTAVLAPGAAPPPAQGQPAKAAKALPADLALVPAGTPLVVTVRPGDLLADPLFAALIRVAELDVFTELMVPVPVAEVERVTFLPDRLGKTFIVRTARPYDLDKVLVAALPGRRKASGKTVGGKTVYAPDGEGALDDALAVVNRQVFAVGPHGVLKELLTGKVARTADFEQALRQAEKHTLGAFASGRRLREEMGLGERPGKGGKGEPAPLPPTELLPYQPLAESKRALLTADVKPGLKLDLAFTFEKADDLDDAETALKTALYVLRETAGAAQLEPDLRLVAPLLEPFADGLRAAKVTRKGVTLRASVQVNLGAARRKKLVEALAKKLVEQRAVNNLKIVGIALHSYHAANGAFPPPAVTAPAVKGKAGKALLSWRVALLPYLKEDGLYRQFKLDEAWDSGHNKRLLARMPKVYAPAPGVRTKEAHATFLQLFTGPGTPFPRADSRPRVTSFPDGLSKTFLVAEAGEAVPWTKPQDIALDPKKAPPKLGAQFDGIFLALMGDGSVRKFTRDIDAKLLRAIISPDGGETYNATKYRR